MTMVQKRKVAQRVTALEGGAGVALAEEPSLARLYKHVDAGTQPPDTPRWRAFVASLQPMFERVLAEVDAETNEESTDGGQKGSVT